MKWWLRVEEMQIMARGLNQSRMMSDCTWCSSPCRARKITMPGWSTSPNHSGGIFPSSRLKKSYHKTWFSFLFFLGQPWSWFQNGPHAISKLNLPKGFDEIINSNPIFGYKQSIILPKSRLLLLLSLLFDKYGISWI